MKICHFTIALYIITLATQSAVSQSFDIDKGTPIAESGASSMKATSRGERAAITIRTVQVERSNVAFPLNTFDVSSVAFVKELSIEINGSQIFVPRAVYSDLLDPNRMQAKFDKGVLVLWIVGADGAESYGARIYCNSIRVTRRLIYSLLDTKTPAEDSRYFMTGNKDE